MAPSEAEGLNALAFGPILALSLSYRRRKLGDPKWLQDPHVEGGLAPAVNPVLSAAVEMSSANGAAATGAAELVALVVDAAYQL